MQVGPSPTQGNAGGESGGQCLDSVEGWSLGMATLSSSPSFSRERVTTPFSERVDAKRTWLGVYDRMSCGKLVGKE